MSASSSAECGRGCSCWQPRQCAPASSMQPCPLRFHIALPLSDGDGWIGCIGRNVAGLIVSNMYFLFGKDFTMSFSFQRCPSKPWMPLLLNRGGFRLLTRSTASSPPPAPAPRGKWQQTCRRRPPASLTLPLRARPRCHASPHRPLVRTYAGGRERSAYFCVKSVFMAGRRLGEISVAKRLRSEGRITVYELTTSAVLSEESFCPRFDLEEITRLWLLQCRTAEWTE